MPSARPGQKVKLKTRLSYLSDGSEKVVKQGSVGEVVRESVFGLSVRFPEGEFKFSWAPESPIHIGVSDLEVIPSETPT